MLAGMNTIIERLYVARNCQFVGLIFSKNAHFERYQGTLSNAVVRTCRNNFESTLDKMQLNLRSRDSQTVDAVP